MAHMFMPVYNVDAAVGAGQPNSPDDVRLVQLLFMQLAPSAPNTFRGLPPLAADGVYTANLGNWILAYQRASPALARDGKIDPIGAREGRFVTNIGSHRSTLLLMNFNCAHHNASAHRRIAEQMRLVIRFHLT